MSCPSGPSAPPEPRAILPQRQIDVRLDLPTGFVKQEPRGHRGGAAMERVIAVVRTMRLAALAMIIPSGGHDDCDA